MANPSPPVTMIGFAALHHCLQKDPYYGNDTPITTIMLRDLDQEKEIEPQLEKFETWCSTLPEPQDNHRQLIYAWCALLGLPGYRNNDLLDWGEEQEPTRAPADFDLNLDEIKTFLSQRKWPVPAQLFPDEANNTKRRLAHSEEAFNQAFHDAAVVVPALELKREELQRIQPESMAALKEKETQIKQIDDEIDRLKFGPPSEQSDKNTEPEVGSPEWRSKNARHAANVKHSQPGGSRDKRAQARKLWASGKYKTRTELAEKESSSIGISIGIIKKALANIPGPNKKPSA